MDTIDADQALADDVRLLGRILGDTPKRHEGEPTSKVSPRACAIRGGRRVAHQQMGRR